MYQKIRKVKQEKIKEYNWENKVILVCEDTETSNLYFRAALIRTNAKVIWADNGEKGLKICQERDDIDLVLMDIRMPKMDGITATREIKKIKKHLPVIIQTAYFFINEKENSYEAGCDEFITKPINLSDLLNTIDKFIN